ncbi:MAG: PLP-dependent transferase [Verrucomicrobia bacterium]|nr:PLP-dependent transferase [Verrucomicrobiota bacterium]
MKSDPRWREGDLGQAIPDSRHAVSVALPLWSHVVGYEENDPAILSRMQLGYPRFMVHPKVRQLAQDIAGTPHALPLPSRRAAERCKAFIAEKSGQDSRITEAQGIAVVSTTAEGAKALKAYWQHTGQIVTSRWAEALLEGRRAPANSDVACDRLRETLAGLYECSAQDVFLFSCGMAAVDAAAQAVRALIPGRPTAQVGFPYLDSLKVQEKFGHGVKFILSGGSAPRELRSLLKENALAGVFCEVPSNPLLESPDIVGLSTLLRAHAVPLVVDDVVATPYNIDVSAYADLVVTSLTKYLSGHGNVMGGAIICNPASPLHAQLRAIVEQQYEPLVWGEDAIEIDQQSRGFRERMQQHNRGGEFIAEHLRDHPAVEKVWYPKWDQGGHYEQLRRPRGGYSSLLSFLVKNPAQNAARFYDALELCKGPTLGTDFTLVCPYTLLAHYGELDWAESCGVSRYLIRASIGIEPPEHIWKRFKAALEKVDDQ